MILPHLEHRNNFNPRSREGSDRGPRSYEAGRCISIHAPVKGATVPSIVIVSPV